MAKHFDLSDVTAREAARRGQRRVTLAAGALLVLIALVALACGLLPHITAA